MKIPDPLRSAILSSPAGPILRRARAAAQGKPAPVTQPKAAPRVIRRDPIPAPQPFPDARYVFAVGAIPRNYGGRTASILTKTKLMSDAGVASEILTMNYSAELADVTEQLRERGVLGELVSVVNLHEILGGSGDPTAAPVEHPIEIEGLVWEKMRDQPVYRYYADGVYRLFRRYDRHGRLLLEDHFNPNRARTRRDEYTSDGRIRRTTYFDLHYNRPRQEVYFRPDGTAYMNRWLIVNPADLSLEVERVTLFDEDGAITRVLHTYDDVVREYLDRVVGDDHVFLTIESRATDKETLPWQRPNVKQVYVLHNPHVRAPFTDPTLLRPIYRPLLEARDQVAATVFLTEAQRADAEAVFGTTPSWKVIPHPARPTTDAGVARDPKLAVMLARLDQQKQLNHAIRAFAHVVARVPDARLEIWGQGTDQKALAALIKELGLGASVKLMGYTRNPDEVYQRAAVTLVTSKYEGFGLVILESLLNGCPVVSYDLSYGPSDILTDGVNGYLVPAGGIKRLAAKVADVLSDPALQARLSAGTVDVRERFSPEVFLARWSALFNELDAQGWD